MEWQSPAPTWTPSRRARRAETAAANASPPASAGSRRRCVACGHVGCCDSSPGRHATAHFEQSGHPLMQSFEPGEEWYWCYPRRAELRALRRGSEPVSPLSTQLASAARHGARSLRRPSGLFHTASTLAPTLGWTTPRAGFRALVARPSPRPRPRARRRRLRAVARSPGHSRMPSAGSSRAKAHLVETSPLGTYGPTRWGYGLPG